MIFDRGTHVQWATVDGKIHNGVVRHAAKNSGHIVLEDGEEFPKFIPTGICSGLQIKKKVKL